MDWHHWPVDIHNRDYRTLSKFYYFDCPFFLIYSHLWKPSFVTPDLGLRKCKWKVRVTSSQKIYERQTKLQWSQLNAYQLFKTDSFQMQFPKCASLFALQRGKHFWGFVCERAFAMSRSLRYSTCTATCTGRVFFNNSCFDWGQKQKHSFLAFHFLDDSFFDPFSNYMFLQSVVDIAHSYKLWIYIDSTADTGRITPQVHFSCSCPGGRWHAFFSKQINARTPGEKGYFAPETAQFVQQAIELFGLHR